MSNPTDRAARGLALFEAGHVSELVFGGAYFVRSTTSTRSYLVLCATQGGDPARCTCPDHAHRGGRCAHLYAVAAHLVRESKVDRSVALSCVAAPERPLRPVPVTVPTPRPYQDWSATTAHAHQVNNVLRQVSDLCQPLHTGHSSSNAQII
jgi:SWIM zinc finger